MLSEMAAPDWTGNRTGGPRRTGGQDRARAGPGPEDRTGSTAETARADGLQRWTKAGDGHHQHQGQDRTGARADGGAVAERIETAIENRRAKTPPARRPGPSASRAGGVLCARCSLLIAGYIRPPSPHQPARQDAGTGLADGDRDRPATPDHKTAPAQDSTHTRTGANQNRARGRRYSLDTPRRLRVRERRIFLGMKNFFRLPPR